MNKLTQAELEDIARVIWAAAKHPVPGVTVHHLEYAWRALRMAGYEAWQDDGAKWRALLASYTDRKA